METFGALYRHLHEDEVIHNNRLFNLKSHKENQCLEAEGNKFSLKIRRSWFCWFDWFGLVWFLFFLMVMVVVLLVIYSLTHLPI